MKIGWRIRLVRHAGGRSGIGLSRRRDAT